MKFLLSTFLGAMAVATVSADCPDVNAWIQCNDLFKDGDILSLTSSDTWNGVQYYQVQGAIRDKFRIDAECPDYALSQMRFPATANFGSAQRQTTEVSNNGVDIRMKPVRRSGNKYLQITIDPDDDMKTPYNINYLWGSYHGVWGTVKYDQDSGENPKVDPPSFDSHSSDALCKLKKISSS
eukprot:Clim_evm10s73 gene=Clim_evmTU10s73